MNIGIVPQDLAIYEDLTAYANVKFLPGFMVCAGPIYTIGLKKHCSSSV